jgi:hypothetical protein
MALAELLDPLARAPGTGSHLASEDWPSLKRPRGAQSAAAWSVARRATHRKARGFWTSLLPVFTKYTSKF